MTSSRAGGEWVAAFSTGSAVTLIHNGEGLGTVAEVDVEAPATVPTGRDSFGNVDRPVEPMPSGAARFGLTGIGQQTLNRLGRGGRVILRLKLLQAPVTVLNPHHGDTAPPTDAVPLTFPQASLTLGAHVPSEVTKASQHIATPGRANTKSHAAEESRGGSLDFRQLGSAGPTAPFRSINRNIASPSE